MYPVGLDPHKMTVACFIEGGDGLRGRLPDEFRRERQFEFFAQYSAYSEQIDRGLRQ